MTIKTIIDFIIMSITFGSAIVFVGYEDYARARGLPVSTRLSRGASLFKLVSLATIFIVLGISFYLYRWWSPLVVFFLGFLYSFTSLLVLKQRMQVVGALGAVIGLALCLSYVLLVS